MRARLYLLRLLLDKPFNITSKKTSTRTSRWMEILSAGVAVDSGFSALRTGTGDDIHHRWGFLFGAAGFVRLQYPKLIHVTFEPGWERGGGYSGFSVKVLAGFALVFVDQREQREQRTNEPERERPERKKPATVAIAATTTARQAAESQKAVIRKDSFLLHALYRDTRKHLLELYEPAGSLRQAGVCIQKQKNVASMVAALFVTLARLDQRTIVFPGEEQGPEKAARLLEEESFLESLASIPALRRFAVLVRDYWYECLKARTAVDNIRFFGELIKELDAAARAQSHSTR